MARTKGDTVRLALAKIGVTSFGYEVPPDQLRDGLIVLESMMAAWDANGVKVGYKLADTPEQAQAMSDEHLEAARDLSRSPERKALIEAEIAKQVRLMPEGVTSDLRRLLRQHTELNLETLGQLTDVELAKFRITRTKSGGRPRQ